MRNKNACFVRMSTDGINFICGASATVCDFGVYKDDIPSHVEQFCFFQRGPVKLQCTNQDAQNDAMSRAVHAIQQEQAKRANAVLAVEEEVERRR